jgi:acetate CoA/acetoacetate CoA-transferase alpha subunit
MDKTVSKDDVKAIFASGQRIMIGGFANHGSPERLIDLLIETGASDLTIISNDTGDPGLSVGKLVRTILVKKIICSHVGMNPEAGKAYMAGKFQLELVPQGTLVEQIRSGGAGIGGVLVKTGLGTMVEEGKQKVVVDGETYLFEKALKADIALIKAHKADTFGNLVYRGTSRNFNPLMAMAAKIVIVEADEIVPVGTLDPDNIVTPGLFINMILKNE